MSTSPPSSPLFEARGVTKLYGAQKAVADVDFVVGHSEIVGLLGDNGAGKSTLVKILSGVVTPNAGRFFVDGAEVSIRNRQQSEAAGIETIYQDSALVDSMSITRNIFMGRELVNKWGFLEHRKMRETALRVLDAAVHISGVENPNKEVGQLSGGQKQAVAIARAIYFKRRILILDEPTSALSVREISRLLNYVETLRKDGVSSVLVTHNIYHAYQVCDRFVVMSHGAKIRDVAKAETSVDAITQYVVQH